MAKDEESNTKHRDFWQWALSNGIQINGVAPFKFPGRGMGIIATRTIEANEIMIAVPVSTMLTIDSVPREFIDRFPNDSSVHGILAAFLTHGDANLLDRWTAWRKTWPSRQHFQESLPVLWPESPPSYDEGHIPLPPSVSGQFSLFSIPPRDSSDQDIYQNVLRQQQKRLFDAWDLVSSVFPATDWSLFSYHWLILNTRSFYYVSPNEDPPDDWNDAIGLVPFGDYFNHADNAPCEVVFDGKFSTFRATTRHEKGKEVFMSYGSHPNDYLLVEYGFFLDQNESDAIFLDEIVFQDITFDDKETLRTHGYNSHYELNSSGPSPNLSIVASFKCMERDDWKKHVLGQPSSGPISEDARNWIRKWVKTYLDESQVAINGLEGEIGAHGVVWSSENLPPSWKGQKVAILLRRWIQIREICEKTLEKLA